MRNVCCSPSQHTNLAVVRQRTQPPCCKRWPQRLKWLATVWLLQNLFWSNCPWWTQHLSVGATSSNQTNTVIAASGSRACHATRRSRVGKVASNCHNARAVRMRQIMGHAEETACCEQHLSKVKGNTQQQKMTSRTQSRRSTALQWKMKKINVTCKSPFQEVLLKKN